MDYPDYIPPLLIRRHKSDDYEHHRPFYKALIFGINPSTGEYVHVEACWQEIGVALAQVNGQPESEWIVELKRLGNERFIDSLLMRVENLCFSLTVEGRVAENKKTYREVESRVKDFKKASEEYKKKLSRLLEDDPHLIERCKSLHLNHQHYLSFIAPPLAGQQNEKPQPRLIVETLSAIENEVTHALDARASCLPDIDRVTKDADARFAIFELSDFFEKSLFRGHDALNAVATFYNIACALSGNAVNENRTSVYERLRKRVQPE